MDMPRQLHSMAAIICMQNALRAHLTEWNVKTDGMGGEDVEVDAT